MRLASYLVKSRHGIFYLRLVRGGKERRRSLGTRDPNQAKIRAYQFGAAIMAGFPDLDNIKGWTVRKDANGSVEISTDGSADDHSRALEALTLMMGPGQPLVSPPPPAVQKISIPDAIRKYMRARDGQITAGTQRTWQTSFNRLSREFGARYVDEISPEEITGALNRLGSSAAPKTVTKEAQTWAMLWRWLIDHKYALNNPVIAPTYGRAQLVRLKEERGRERLAYAAEDLKKIFDPARLATRDVYHSHGAVIDSEEATNIGLIVESYDHMSQLWKKIWLLRSMYSFDCQQDGYSKLFEAQYISSPVSIPAQHPQP